MRKGIFLMKILLAATILFLISCGGGGGGGTSSQPPSQNQQPTVNTTSAGIAVVSVNGQDIGLIPAGSSLTPVPLNPSQIGAYLTAAQVSCNKVGNQGYVCTVQGAPQTSFILDSCAADPILKKVVCIGYNSQKVAIFDLSQYLNTLNPADITVTECDLDPNITIPSTTFSGGSCINCGVAADPGDNRFIVASGDGFRVVGYSVNQTTGACDVKKTYLLSNYGIATVNENFSYNPQKNWILNPEYNTPAKFWIIDVNSDKAYSWDTTIDCSSLDPNNTNCSLWEIDSISIDTTTGIAIMSDEWKLNYILVDLGQANFNPTTNTFTAPYAMVYMQNTSDTRYTGTAIEPNSHIAFLEEEFGNGIAVLQLPSSSGSGGTFPTPASWSYNSLSMLPNDVCDASPGDGTANYWWSNPGDPHGLSIFTGSNNGVAYGIAISKSKDCIAIVNLQKFLNAPKASGFNYVDPNYDLFGNGVLYFIKIQ